MHTTTHINTTEEIGWIGLLYPTYSFHLSIYDSYMLFGFVFNVSVLMCSQ